MKKLLILLALCSCQTIKTGVLYEYQIDVLTTDARQVTLVAYTPNIGLKEHCIMLDGIKMHICGIEKIERITKVKITY